MSLMEVALGGSKKRGKNGSSGSGDDQCDQVKDLVNSLAGLRGDARKYNEAIDKIETVQNEMGGEESHEWKNCPYTVRIIA